MATLTIRKLDDRVKAKLRIRAAQHGRSMEEEAREILARSLSSKPEKATNLYVAIRRRLDEAGIEGVDLPEYVRESGRELPTFD